MNNHPVRHLLVALCLVVLVSSVSSSAEQKWGSLKGRFVYTEGAITPEKLNVNKDAEYCTKHNLLDEQIMTGEKGELQNVFVYLNTKKGKTVPVHPALEAVNTKPAVLDNKGCSFQPHAMVIRINQPLEIKNTDSIGHNTNFQTMPHLNPPFNQIIPSSASITKSFEKQESYPSSVVCNIHPWMKAYVLIRDIPYMAVSGKDGSFVIKNIPAGEHEFIFWHEAPGVLRKLKVGDAETSRKGRAKLKIPADETLDLGDIKVTPKVLGK